jgi:hypothetical protein
VSSIRVHLLLGLVALAAIFPASASAWETIGPVEATYSKSFPGEAAVTDSYDYAQLPMSEWVMGDPRPRIGKDCFSKPVRVEAQVRGKPAISFTGGPDCLNANWGGTRSEPIDPCFIGPGLCGTRTVNVPPDPAAVKLYAGDALGVGASSSAGEAKGYGIQIYGCYEEEGGTWNGVCLSLVAKRKTKPLTVAWRIYYDDRLIGAETVRLSNRYIPGRKGKGEYLWAGTDAYWNVCIRGNRDIYSRNGRLYCYFQLRAPRKARWEPVTKRLAGPSPGKLEK